MTALVCWTLLIAGVVTWLTGTHEAQVMVKPRDKMHWQGWDGGEPPRDIMWYKFVMDARLALLKQFDLGPRGHVWFRWYHAIAVGMRLGWAVLGAWMLAVALMVSLTQYLLLLALVLVVLNDGYEYAYSYGRFRVWFNPYAESFNLADIVKWHWGSRFAHVMRGTAIVALTTVLIGG